MRLFRGFIFVPVALTACALDAGPERQEAPVASRSDELVGGRVATEAEYPSTVYLGGCTGVKVGPRHFLSAAHCFSGNEQYLNVTPDNEPQQVQSLTITSVNIHPEYAHCTACAGDGSMEDFGYRPDIALITVHELTPTIPEAVIDPTPVEVGDPVTLTGYGCENGVGQPVGPARFKVGDTNAVDPLSVSGAATIPDGYVTTVGPAVDPDSPGLCPGDSGGPLFRTDTNLVVGINALVSYVVDTGAPIGNWHTRVDAEARYDVWSWVTNLIAQVPATPCADLCESPEVFTSQWYSSGNLGTQARCFETTAPLSSGNCGGFSGGRTLSINGAALSCNGQGWTLPPKQNGGYCVQVAAGHDAWAWFTTW